MIHRITQLVTLYAVIQFIGGIFYMAIAINTQDYFRMVVALTFFTEAAIVYMISIYLNFFFLPKQEKNKAE